MIKALSFVDILREERAIAEVNHCHGPGRGHPCSGSAKEPKYGEPGYRTLADRGFGLSRAEVERRMAAAPPLSAYKADDAADATFADDQSQAAAVGGWARLAVLRQVAPVAIRPRDLPLLRQAADDWTSGRAHMTRDGKHYRVRTERSAVPTSRYSGRSTAPAWSRVVKRYFPDNLTFHKFATAT